MQQSPHHNSHSPHQQHIQTQNINYQTSHVANMQANQNFQAIQQQQQQLQHQQMLFHQQQLYNQMQSHRSAPHNNQ